MKYRLRTLMIVMAILPPLLAVGWWSFGTGRLAYIDAIIAAIAFLWSGYIFGRFVEVARGRLKGHHPTKIGQRQSHKT